MQFFLLVVQFFLAICLVGVILFQRTAQDGGGLMGGNSTMGGLFTARGSANLLTRATAIFATLFILNSLALGYIASHQHQAARGSLVDQIAPLSSSAPAAPAVPVGQAAPSSAPATPASPAAKAPDAPKAEAPKADAPKPHDEPEVPVSH